MEWCKHPETGLPKPDAVFFLTMSSEALARRGGFGDERYETNEIQEKVKNNFLKLKDNTWQVRRQYLSSLQKIEKTNYEL